MAGTSFLGLQLDGPTLVRGTATLLAALGISVGASALLSPAAYATTFGFPPSSPHASAAASNPFVFVAGGRAIAGSLGILGCVLLKADRALGAVMMSTLVAGGLDGVALVRFSEEGQERTEAGKAAWGHWLLNAGIAAVGAWAVATFE